MLKEKIIILYKECNHTLIAIFFTYARCKRKSYLQIYFLDLNFQLTV